MQHTNPHLHHEQLTLALKFSGESTNGNILNCTLCSSDSAVLYQISTPDAPASRTTIRGVPNNEEVGVLDKKGLLSIQSREYFPVGGILESGTTFQFSNGKRYTWKHHSSSGKTILMTSIKPHATIATYTTRYIDNKSPTLEISNSSTGPTTNEIITTLVYTERCRQDSYSTRIKKWVLAPQPRVTGRGVGLDVGWAVRW
ncbi:hypothetical protein AAF712_010246 [Marasmius tenuissimus]|uniref:DUF6593 domain-containing protein n=1 Tax=Marasmius tenuissimus TaxID=585030 RepID=A0ABR2ZQ42_9AGAR